MAQNGDPSRQQQHEVDEEFRIENGGEGDLDLQGYDQDDVNGGQRNDIQDDTFGPQEWEQMEIPEEWKFLPIIRVKYVPKSVPEEELVEFLETRGVEVRGIFAEPTAEQSQKYSCIVRVAPQPYSETDVEAEESDTKKGEGGEKATKSKKLPGYASVPSNVLNAKYPQDGDTVDMSKWLIRKMASKGELVLSGNTLHLECPFLYICLVISNLPSEWEDEGALRRECEKYGVVERCFHVTNAHGQKKGYAYVEYQTYMAAKLAKEAFDRLTNSTFQKIPQMRAKAASEGQGSDSQEAVVEAASANQPTRFQIRIMRAEWASPKKISDLFGRHLYVANLKKGFDNSLEMKKVFEQYGPVVSCQVAKERGSGRAKDYGFVEFRRSDHADAAMRVLDGLEHEKMGKLGVSYIPPAKLVPNQGGGSKMGGGRGGFGGMRGRGRGRGRGMMGRHDNNYIQQQQYQAQVQYQAYMQQQQMAMQMQQQHMRAMQMQQQQLALAQQQLQVQQVKAREELAQISMQKQTEMTQLQQMRQENIKQQQTQQQQMAQQQHGIAARESTSYQTPQNYQQQGGSSYYGSGTPQQQGNQEQYGSGYGAGAYSGSYNYPGQQQQQQQYDQGNYNQGYGYGGYNQGGYQQYPQQQAVQGQKRPGEFQNYNQGYGQQNYGGYGGPQGTQDFKRQKF